MILYMALLYSFFFFFNDTATTEIYTLSLHDALPISGRHAAARAIALGRARSGRASRLRRRVDARAVRSDRKSTRLNSSHLVISYAVFCLKKKKKDKQYMVKYPTAHDDITLIRNNSSF